MSWLNAEAKANIAAILVTPEVSQAPISSFKDAAAALQELDHEAPQNKYDMSVTPDVRFLGTATATANKSKL